MMQVGVGLTKGADNKHWVMLQAMDGGIAVNVGLTSEDDYEANLDAIIQGLIQMKHDMKRELSGLVVVKGGLDGNIQVQEGRPKRGSRKPGQPGPRPA